MKWEKKLKDFFGKSHVALKSTQDKYFKIVQNLLLDLVFAVVCTIDMTARWQQWQQCHCPSTLWRKPVSWRESQKCKPTFQCATSQQPAIWRFSFICCHRLYGVYINEYRTAGWCIVFKCLLQTAQRRWVEAYGGWTRHPQWVYEAHVGGTPTLTRGSPCHS